MKILIFWDIYWRIWRKALKKEIPNLKEKYNPDFIIANLDNVTSWRWAIEKHVLELESLWIDLMTSWDHFFDNYDKIKDYLNLPNSKFIRCANFIEYWDYKIAWKWYKILEKNNKNLLVIHLMCETFMKYSVTNPFHKVDEILEKYKWKDLDWIIIDFHKETSSSWYGMWFYLDWKVSFIFWTHTHIQTNDELILPKWTWLISDVWMSWPLYSVIWADYDSVKKRFLTWIWRWKIEQCLDKNYVVNWVCVEIWNDMICKNIEKIRIREKI